MFYLHFLVLCELLQYVGQYKEIKTSTSLITRRNKFYKILINPLIKSSIGAQVVSGAFEIGIASKYQNHILWCTCLRLQSHSFESGGRVFAADFASIPD